MKDRRRSRFGRRAKVLLLVGSTVLALAGAECMLRMCWHNPYRNDGPDRYVNLRVQHPTTDHVIDRSEIHPESPSTRFRTDHRSYILPSFQHAQPDCTITFLGGSTTECCAVTEELRFPALVSTLLEQDDLRVNTLNAGTSGNTLHDSINILLNHAILDKPDVLVLMHACNDIGLLSEAGSYAPRSEKNVRLDRFLRIALMNGTNHSWLMAVARQALREHSHFVPIAPDELQPGVANFDQQEIDAAFTQRLQVFISICRAFQVEPVLMTQPTSGHYTALTPKWADEFAQTRFNEIIRQMGREKNVMVIDLMAHLQRDVPQWDEHLNLFYDGVHVTDRGSKIYAEYIAQQILPVVQRVAGKQGYRQSEPRRPISMASDGDSQLR